MHLHANRVWVLGAGGGGLEGCLAYMPPKGKKILKVDQINMGLTYPFPNWIKWRGTIEEVGGEREVGIHFALCC